MFLRAIQVILILALGVPASSAAGDGAFAPLSRPGPPLGIAKEKLRASVECTADVADASRAPVLLLPATGVDSHSNYSWNYEQLFEAEGIPYCTSDQPGKRSTNLTDIQVRGKYVTYAIRHVYRRAGRKIAVMGHSQGGMAMRFPLRFWPDTRKMVDDVIGFAGTNHGTEAGGTLCASGCTPAAHQQGADSAFVAALNSRSETFASISYTEVFTIHDEVVTPPREASSVSGPGRIANVAVQEICPLDPNEHLGIGTVDAVASALALDALDHDGPAHPGRVDPAVCVQPFMPGFNPATNLVDLALAASQLAGSQLEPGVPSEPRLRCWVFKDVRGCRRSRRSG